MKLLVTGGSGLIGFHLLNLLKKQNDEVSVFYNENKPQSGFPIKLPLTDSEILKRKIREIKPDVILHLAAITSVDQCESDKKLADLINAKATAIIAEEASKQKIFLLYVSTDYVFDGKKGLYNEHDVPNPINHYGASKYEGELAVKNSSSWCIIRTGTPFGLHPYKKSFPLWLIENMKIGKKINVVSDQFTSPTYVPNLCKMLLEITMKKLNGVFHLAGATRISRYDFAQMICQRLGLDGKLIQPISIYDIDWLAKRPKDSSLDVSKASNYLIEKPIKIEDALNSFIRDYMQQIRS